MKAKKIPLPDIDSGVETVIVANGSYPERGLPAALLAEARRVVCCDGAADKYLAHGKVPDAIIGDGDSVSDAVRREYGHLLHLTSEQETNDLTKSVRFCAANGWRNITILGATGGREDHTIGNVGLLADYVRIADSVRMVTETGVFDAIHETTVFECRPRQQISIFTLNAGVPLRADNLKYTLPAEGFRSWWCGTLNETLTDNFTVYTDCDTIVFRAFELK